MIYVEEYRAASVLLFLNTYELICFKSEVYILILVDTTVYDLLNFVVHLFCYPLVTFHFQELVKSLRKQSF